MRKYAVAAVALLAVLIIAVVVQRQVTRTAERDVTGTEPAPITSEPRDDAAPGPLAPGILPPDTPGAVPPDVAPDGPVTGPVPADSPATQPPRPSPSPSLPAPAPPAASGEQDTPEGARILQQAAEVYAGIRTMQADFTMRTENPLLRTAVTSRGTLYQRRPDRIALRFSDPAGDVIVGDGTHFWIYYPSTDARQVIRSPAEAGGAGGVDLQAQFLGDPVRRFEHVLHGTEDVRGRNTHAMTLVPREAMGYARLRVWIDAQDRLVRRFEITEHNGAVRLLDLEGLRTNITIADDIFRFTPPADARVIDRG